jgi:hypothetical protein
MPLCTVCTQPARGEIDTALLEHRQSVRYVAAQFGVTPQSLFRHYDTHLARTLREAHMRMNGAALRARVEATDALMARQIASLEAEDDWRAHALAAELGRRWIGTLHKLGLPLELEAEQRVVAAAAPVQNARSLRDVLKDAIEQGLAIRAAEQDEQQQHESEGWPSSQDLIVEEEQPIKRSVPV